MKCLANSILHGERGKEWQNGRKGGGMRLRSQKHCLKKEEEEGWRERGVVDSCQSHQRELEEKKK